MKNAKRRQRWLNVSVEGKLEHFVITDEVKWKPRKTCLGRCLNKVELERVLKYL